MASVAAISQPSLLVRVVGAVVPALCLAGALVTWEIWRIAGAVTESLSVQVSLYRIAVHVVVVVLPLVALVLAMVAPPRTLSVRGYAGIATLAAIVAVVWTPIAMFITYFLGA